MANKTNRRKRPASNLTADQQERRDVLRRMQREKRDERKIHLLIGQVMRMAYNRRQRMLQLASAIVGPDWKIVPAKSQTALDRQDHESAAV